jgi:hypothetical protein
MPVKKKKKKKNNLFFSLLQTNNNETLLIRYTILNVKSLEKNNACTFLANVPTFPT